MGRSQREKGTRGELEACRFLRSFQKDGVPVDATRTYHQARGGTEAADIDHSVFGFHIEVTLSQKCDIGTAALLAKVKQAIRDVGERIAVPAGSSPGITPVVLWHPPRKSWRVSWMGFHLCVCTADAADWMYAQGYMKK